MTTFLTVQDFFAVGLGLDLAGGYLVARGLLSDEADMATARTWAGMGAQATVSKASDRIDAKIGLVSLGTGFSLQVGGYVAAAAGLKAGPTGWLPAVVFFALTVVALLAALFVHRLLGPSRKRRVALRVVLLDGHGLPTESPDGKSLMDLGVELGDPALPDESYGAYARRVWCIGSVSGEDEVPAEAERPQRQAGRKRWT